jgi:hypothetical protein
MRGCVGVVVPAWFSAATAQETAERLLLTTLAGSEECLDPADVVVVVDGSEPARRAARALEERLAAEWGAPFHLIDRAENRGKGAALAVGVRYLLARPVRWIAARDADGDHLIDDLPHLYRTGEQLARECPGVPIAVIGRRANLHAPLGWLRGEFEVLVNEVLVEAVAFARARESEAWDSRYLAARVPDLQSGYKLYDRESAALAFEALEREAAAHPEQKLERTGMEIVPFVEVALAGGVFGEAERKSYFDQPVTSYGSQDQAAFYGSKLAWALGRCEVPARAAAIMLDSALSRRPLFLDPRGRAEALRMRGIVLEALSAAEAAAGIPAEPRTREFL